MSAGGPSGRIVRLLGGAALVAACMGPYAERPASTANRAPAPRAGDAAERPDSGIRAEGAHGAGGRTVVGYVTPDGRVHADTVAAAPDTASIERQTVVTGIVRAAPAVATPATPTARVAAPGAEGAPVAGYRVQVFAARDPAAAADVARRLEGRLEGVPVYVERADPWYRVQAGDFATREDAETLRVQLVEMGYAEAWTARAPLRTVR